MRRTKAAFMIVVVCLTTIFTCTGPVLAWNSYVHQRLAWMVLPEIANTPMARYGNAMIYGANEPDDYRNPINHSAAYTRGNNAFQAAIGAFQRGCFQETIRRLGHSFHYLEDYGCCRKAFNNRIKDRVEGIAKAMMKETVSSQSSLNTLRDMANEFLAERLNGAQTSKAVFNEVAQARGQFENMIRDLENNAPNDVERLKGYKIVVSGNLAVTVAAMVQLTRIYKRQTSQIWSAHQYSPQCHCPPGHRMNQEHTDCFFGNHSQVITLPRW